MRHVCLILLACVLPGVAQESSHKHGGSGSPKEPASAGSRFGTVEFQNSCDPSVKADFNRSVALLHSFEYPEAQQSFAGVIAMDPKCSMAMWGESMSYFHGLWDEYNPAKGAEAASEATRLAAENPKTTEREKMFIAAIGEIFNDEAIKSSQREDNKPGVSGYVEPSREAELKYTKRMGELHERFPDDREATIFYALALDVSAVGSDKTRANQKRCTALLQPLLAEMPDHPGVAHYIIHCSDNFEMASDGLEAARRYAQIAPASAHATHMPSHIFARLGLWDEMVESNRASVKAAEEDRNASACETVGNTLHAMSFLTVALAETGRLTEARDVVDQAAEVKANVPGGDQCYDEENLVLTTYVLDAGDWGRGKEIRVEGHPGPAVAGLQWFAVGVAAARTGDDVRANEAEQKLIALRDARGGLPGHTAQNSFEVVRLAVAGSRAQQAGQTAEALRLLREAADLQDRLGSGVIIKPTREMLADLLLASGSPSLALTEYKAVLVQHPNRFDSLYGAGSAAFETNDLTAARMYYKELLASAKGTELPELATAQSRMLIKTNEIKGTSAENR